MEEKIYPDFVQNTGYGTGGGLCGWNCRHTFTPFNPETMTNNLKEYGLEENEEMYLNHQKQRYFERNIRKYKRRAETTKHALNEAKSPEKEILEKNYLHNKALVNKWMKNYIAFSKKNNLRTQMDRTEI